jgi:hypothetical protein
MVRVAIKGAPVLVIMPCLLMPAVAPVAALASLCISDSLKTQRHDIWYL